jgi:predicted O-methyltransferase YrrM
LTLLQLEMHDSTYLEWGSGGSTFHFAPYTKGTSYTIEHNADWCEKVELYLKATGLDKKIEYHCVPNGTYFFLTENFPFFL